MSTPIINAIDARINERGFLEVGESFSRNIEIGSEEYISIPLEEKGKTRTTENNMVKEDKPKRTRTKKSETEKTKTTKTTARTKKAETKAKTEEQAPKRKPGRPRKVLPEGEER